ncbi:MAG: hypothetical protein E7035_05030 [Verrucomicrobiaceae bacterium]|nr:hypothetical protein [Verrucomicrobiaceae bacterium]
MKKFKLLSLTAFSLFAATSFGAIDEVIVQRNLSNGKVKTQTVKLQKVNENTYRLHIPVDKMGTWKWTGVDSIDVKREEATAMKGDAGYWVTSNMALGRFSRDNGKYHLRKNMMPMFGVKKGDKAFVAIIKGLVYEFSTMINVKDGKYEIFPRFHLKEIYTKPYEDIIIDFTHFEGKDANYSAMGREYRKYQLERGEVKPLKQRILGNETLQNTVESVYLKTQMATFMREGETGMNRGWHWKSEEDPPIQKIRDFDNIQWFMKKLKEAGVEKIDIILTNWNWRSNGRNPISSIAEPELGGNAKCKETTALAKKLGYRIAPHMLHTENYTISPAFDKNDIALDENGKYRGYMGMGGFGFNPCFKQVYRKHILDNYDRMQKLGFNGTFHIDVTSAIVPYSCHHIEHFSTRKETGYYMNRVGMLSDAFFGAWGSESGVDSTANTLDYVLYATPITPETIGEGKKFPLVDEIVPIWQIVYNGIITNCPMACLIDNTLPENKRHAWWICKWSDAKARRIKEVEFNGRPSFYWGLNDVKEGDFKYIKKAYDDFQPRKHLQLEFMDFHDKIAPNVYITKFSDGTEIISNYSKERFSYKGQNVASMDYRIYAPKKK